MGFVCVSGGVPEGLGHLVSVDRFQSGGLADGEAEGQPVLLLTAGGDVVDFEERVHFCVLVGLLGASMKMARPRPIAIP